MNVTPEESKTVMDILEKLDMADKAMIGLGLLTKELAEMNGESLVLASGDEPDVKSLVIVIRENKTRIKELQSLKAKWDAEDDAFDFSKDEAESVSA